MRGLSRKQRWWLGWSVVTVLLICAAFGSMNALVALAVCALLLVPV